MRSLEHEPAEPGNWGGQGFSLQEMAGGQQFTQHTEHFSSAWAASAPSADALELGKGGFFDHGLGEGASHYD